MRILRTEPSMNTSIEAARQLYAEQLQAQTHMSSRALFKAFATVPRERFVGPGPWRVLGSGEFWMTEDADPRHVYRNVLIALDEAKGINNGQPSMWARFFDQLDVQPNHRVLHLGCGTGYYTAILAELVGADGRILAVEIDQGIAEKARTALSLWPRVTVIHADGSNGPFAPADVIVVSAGVTHPPASWLSALKPGGRLLFPLTPDHEAGAMAYLTRRSTDNFAARLSFGVQFIPFSGARDHRVSGQLAEALHRDEGASVRSLRCDPHEKVNTCWLHGDGWCFSTREPFVLD
jgi:protein-L-isoaspartate(D-aspartate) O-methyltransferase